MHLHCLRCDCPREWRIRKDPRAREQDRPWQVFRRFGEDQYVLAFRAETQPAAVELITVAMASTDRTSLFTTFKGRK